MESVGTAVVTPRFAWSVPSDFLRPLGPLRHWPGIEVAEASPRVWLRAGHLEAGQWEQVRRLPDADRYTVVDGDVLVRAGGRVPCGQLPPGPWHPLARWLAVTTPAADVPVSLPRGHALRLVRSLIERDSTWLEVSLATWTAYAVIAPQVRLARWTFAADRRGQVVIRGAPLPPLPGDRFVDHDGIAVPEGWTWTPHVPPDVLRAAFALGEGDTLLWTLRRGCERIAADDWVRATRSAARLTASARRPDREAAE